MPWYRTEYEQGADWAGAIARGTYGNIVWAKDRPNAVRTVKRRRMGERIVGGPELVRPWPLLSEQLIAHERLDTCMHSAIFLGWAALRAAVVHPDLVLGDTGLVHELIHVKTGIKKNDYRDRLIAQAKLIEGKVPGWIERRRAKP